MAYKPKVLAVIEGGTGAVTLTNHGLIIGQGTSALVALAAGTAGQILRSGGAGADPAYSTATYPATAGTAGKILISDGTNIVSSTPTYPNASVTAGKVIISDGTNYIASTPTFPNASATSGKFIRSDGTNWIASTPTLPTTAGTSGNVLTSDGTNWLSSTFPTRVTTINGDSGSITGATVTIYANNAANATGASVKFTNSSATSTLSLVDANDNILIGRVSGNLTLTGLQNTGVGTGTLNGLTSGSSNVAMGYTAAQLMQSGVQNVAIGREALISSLAGNGNVAVGFQALNLNTSSTGSNTAVGWRSLNNIVGGNTNTALGIGSGSSYTGSESSNIVIQNSGTLGESNTIRIGTQGSSAGQQNVCFIAGIASVATANTAITTINTSTGQLGSVTSVAIANGGTNATSFGTSTGIVKYDGTSLVTSTTAKIDSSNRMTNSSQPCFTAYSNTAVTNQTGDGTAYTVVFGTEIFDQANNFDGTSTFTAPVTGRYLFNVTVLSQNNGTTHNPNMRLVTTARSYTFGNYGGSFAGNFVLHGSVIADMTASDTATVQILTSNSTKTVGVYGAANDPRTIFSGMLIA